MKKPKTCKLMYSINVFIIIYPIKLTEIIVSGKIIVQNLFNLVFSENKCTKPIKYYVPDTIFPAKNYSLN